MEEVNVGESWNKKRIFIAVFLLILLTVGGYFFRTRIFGENLLQQLRSVKGTSIKEEIPLPEFKMNVQEAVKEKINSLKQEVLGLNVLEIASSSPQVQKILSDIKSLEQYPINQVQEVCKKICGL
ncbi:MAG: hypothetical protein Q8P29_02850 [Candidatus Levybacteria bacterium]|nr:hypothetical protein [Candidatus Levybacteria bacterium]